MPQFLHISLFLWPPYSYYRRQSFMILWFLTPFPPFLIFGRTFISLMKWSTDFLFTCCRHFDDILWYISSSLLPFRSSSVEQFLASPLSAVFLVFLSLKVVSFFILSRFSFIFSDRIYHQCTLSVSRHLYRNLISKDLFKLLAGERISLNIFFTLHFASIYFASSPGHTVRALPGFYTPLPMVTMSIWGCSHYCWWWWCSYIASFLYCQTIADFNASDIKRIYRHLLLASLLPADIYMALCVYFLSSAFYHGTMKLTLTSPLRRYNLRCRNALCTFSL